MRFAVLIPSVSSNATVCDKDDGTLEISFGFAIQSNAEGDSSWVRSPLFREEKLAAVFQ